MFEPPDCAPPRMPTLEELALLCLLNHNRNIDCRGLDDGKSLAICGRCRRYYILGTKLTCNSRTARTCCQRDPWCALNRSGAGISSHDISMVSNITDNCRWHCISALLDHPDDVVEAIRHSMISIP